MQEKVYHRVRKSDEQKSHSHYLLRGNKLKGFSIYRNQDERSDYADLFSVEKGSEMIIESVDLMLDTIFKSDSSLSDNFEERLNFKMVESDNLIGNIHPRIFRPILLDYDTTISDTFFLEKHTDCPK
jgi:hypothetical protein